MTNDAFTLTHIAHLAAYQLSLTFADGETLIVDLSQQVGNAALQALHDPVLFAQAHLGDWGKSVSWVDDELELHADNLRNLAIEQAGGVGHERLWNWMHDHHLTLDSAATALGLSRRMLAYYRSGQKPIPRTVWLACLGFEYQQIRKAA
jgi:hypothetical protein